MQISFKSVIQAAAYAMVMLCVSSIAQDKKVDPTGTWTWTRPARNGGADRKMTLVLKAEGEKVTGKLTSPARGGGDGTTETEIADGKLSGENISFTVTRQFGDNKIVQKYNGKVGADSIKGKMEFERDGQAQSTDWEAKRQTAETK